MTDYTALKLAADAVSSADEWYSSKTISAFPEYENDADFVIAASPAAVRALIAENDAMSGLLKRFVDGEYEQDENQAERHMYFTEAQSLLALVDGELEGHTIVQDSAIKAIHAERDQLRAEIAGLRTGYEAYERVNAELKAEVEALRKLGPSKEIIWCACGDGYPVNSYGAGFMAANGDVCENCDAANGRVEPHLDTPDELKALRQALTDIFNHVEGNTECLVRDLVNWGTPRINPNDFYDECEAIKEIANAALGKGEQS